MIWRVSALGREGSACGTSDPQAGGGLRVSVPVKGSQGYFLVDVARACFFYLPVPSYDEHETG